MIRNEKQIDFKFSKNWKSFIKWYDSYVLKAGCAPLWDVQTKKIEASFVDTSTGTVNWKILWKDFQSWYYKIQKKNEIILWSEQKRQIETLMLGQLSDLNKEQFILVFLHLGKPEMDTQKMTYWEADRVKKSLEGDKNGSGGNEDMERITIVNLSNLIQ